MPEVTTRQAGAAAAPFDPYGRTMLPSETLSTSGGQRQGHWPRYDKYITCFGGSTTEEDALAWLEKFEQAAERNDWPNDIRLKYVGDYLDGIAGSWWTTAKWQVTLWSAPGIEPRKAPVGTFHRAFFDTFVTPELQQAWQTRLEECKQCANEDVSGFAMRLHDIVKRVRLTREITDEYVSNIFLKGLPVALRSKILDFETERLGGEMPLGQRVKMAQSYELNRRRAGDTESVKPATTDEAPMPRMDKTRRALPLYSHLTTDAATTKPQPALAAEPSTDCAHDALAAGNPAPPTQHAPANDHMLQMQRQIDQLTELVKASLQVQQPRPWRPRGSKPCPTCGLIDSAHDWSACRRQGFQ